MAMKVVMMTWLTIMTRMILVIVGDNDYDGKCYDSDNKVAEDHVDGQVDVHYDK